MYTLAANVIAIVIVFGHLPSLPCLLPNKLADIDRSRLILYHFAVRRARFGHRGPLSTKFKPTTFFYNLPWVWLALGLALDT